MPHVQFVRHPEILPYTPVNVAQHKMLLLFRTVKVIVAKIVLCGKGKAIHGKPPDPVAAHIIPRCVEECKRDNAKYFSLKDRCLVHIDN